MDANVILKNRAASMLLAEIQQTPDLLTQLQVYFAPYCDCDVTDWIVSRVQANDQFVKNKIRELLVGIDGFPLARGNFKPVNGQLLSQYCNGYDFVGIYADGNGGEVQKIIEEKSVSQGCTPPDALRFLYPLSTQRAALDAGSSNVVFATEPIYPYYNQDLPDQQLFSVKVPLSSPKTARLQVKVDGLTFGDYENLTLTIASPSSYYDPGTPVVPYNTERDDWQHGTISAIFNPTTRIISIEHPWSGSDRTLGSGVDIVLRKNNIVVGWFFLSYSSEPYDPDSPAAQNPHDLLMIVYGSMN
jgi:hypothetical protein